MLKHKSPLYILLCLTLLTVAIISPTMAQELTPQGICLYREPAPPLAVLNDGTGVVNFYWTIDYATNFNQDYLLEIVPPAPDQPFTIGTFPGETSPIINAAVWDVPVGAPAGCYYGRLTFYSDWCFGSPNKFESRAVVGFVVSPAARLRLCKFWDWNGNGEWDSDEEGLPGWSFTVQKPACSQVIELVTGPDGCTPEVSVPVDATGETVYQITEEEVPGWVKTAPEGDLNPIEISLSSGESREVLFGNWQPVTISGFKALDQAPWPWTTPHWVGDDGQENTPEWEPTAASPFQPNQEFKVTSINLYGAGGLVFLGTTFTDENGYFEFPNVQWEPDFVLEEGSLQSEPPDFPYVGVPTLCQGHDLTQWAGDYFSTVSVSPFQAADEGFTSPDEIKLVTNPPTEQYQQYTNNVFFNQLPSRVWGVMCPEAIELGFTEIAVEKDGYPWPTGSEICCGDCGLYEVTPIDVEPDGLRPGDYTLTPPQLPDGMEWVVVTYYFENGEPKKKSTNIGRSGSYTFYVPSGADVRVDFCILQGDNTRQCYLPVTFTQEGWRAFAAQENKLIAGGMIYSKFPSAFGRFTFYGKSLTNQVVIGKGTKTVTFEGTAGGMNRLSTFLPQTGAANKLDRAYLNPWDKTSAGALAGETLALQMNIAYNDRRLMPRTAGYDLEKFKLANGLFKGKAVGEVLDIANAILGGDLPQRYGLPKDPADPTDTGYKALVAILQAINSNYEFVDFNVYTNRGYLIPNKLPLGPAQPPYYPSVPYVK